MTPCRALIRVRVPDRPGALGLVASRVGAVKADIVGIEIVDRYDGIALDELAVILPDASLVPTVEREIAEVDGAVVAGVEIVDEFPEPRIDEVACATRLARARDAATLAAILVDRVRALAGPEWCVAEGPGVRAGERRDRSEVIESFELAMSGIVLALGRTAPLGRSERALVASYCDLVDALWLRLPRESSATDV